MDSDLYRVKVVEVFDTSVKLLVEVIHPEANDIPDSTGFALKLLHKAAWKHAALNDPSRDDAPFLLTEMSPKDVLDDAFLTRHGSEYVSRVSREIIGGSPEGKTHEEWLKATLDIEVTDPIYTEHLQQGAEYTCPPDEIPSNWIDPASLPDPYVIVPGSIFGNVPGVPAEVRVAAYGASAYRPVNLQSGTMGVDRLGVFQGNVVLYRTKSDMAMQIGTLHIAENTIYVLQVQSRVCWGSDSYEGAFEGKIALAELAPAKEYAPRLPVSDMFPDFTPTNPNLTKKLGTW